MSVLKTLTPKPLPRIYRSPISKRALNRNCCGCSYGHLIFASSRSNVLIADLFSSAEYRLLEPPRGFVHFSFGILTAPPSSSSCMLLLISAGNVLIRNLRDDDDKDWLVYNLNCVSLYHIKSILLFKGKLHILGLGGRIFAIGFDSHMHWKQLPNSPRFNSASLTQLAECDGELLLVCFMSTEKYLTDIIEVYRMDFGEGVWVRVEGIGDWCLFMDYVGKCPLACRNPRNWGGESNCVYFAGPQFGKWSVLPMDGTEFEFMSFNSDRWPSPVWACPSKLL